MRMTWYGVNRMHGKCVLKLFGDSGASAFFGGAASAAPLFYFEKDTGMNLYENLYYKLFAAIADAAESLEQDEPHAARKALIAAMRDAEETVVSVEEWSACQAADALFNAHGAPAAQGRRAMRFRDAHAAKRRP